MTWTTADELRFLRGLGVYSTDNKKDRLTLLKGYREGMKQRTDWGVIDKGTVATYVDEQIQLTTTQKGDK